MKDTVDPTVEQYVTTSAKSGAPTLQVVLSDGRKRFLHSPYDPQEEAQRWAVLQEFGPRDIVVVFGIGLGYHVRELVPLLSPTNRLILVEADPSLQNYLASDRRKSSARVPSSAQVVELRKLARLFDDIPFVQWTPLRLLALPAFTEIFAQAWQEAATEVHRLLSTYLVFRNTVLKFSMLWLIFPAEPASLPCFTVRPPIPPHPQPSGLHHAAGSASRADPAHAGVVSAQAPRPDEWSGCCPR